MKEITFSIKKFSEKKNEKSQISHKTILYPKSPLFKLCTYVTTFDLMSLHTHTHTHHTHTHTHTHTMQLTSYKYIFQLPKHTILMSLPLP